MAAENMVACVARSLAAIISTIWVSEFSEVFVFHEELFDLPEPFRSSNYVFTPKKAIQSKLILSFGSREVLSAGQSHLPLLTAYIKAIPNLDCHACFML